MLDRNGLPGPIPTELGRLTELKAIHLGHNELSGPIPIELTQLTNLYDLSLDSNGLTLGFLAT